MIHSTTLIAILLVAATTYLTRILGYVLLKNKTLSNKQRKILEVVPGCVLISVIAPYFVKDNVADLLAIAITLIAASRERNKPVHSRTTSTWRLAQGKSCGFA
jgi:uncharacterized membrane protein